MNSCSHTSPGACSPLLNGQTLHHSAGENLAAFLLPNLISDALRPTTLRALLLLSGASQAHDPVLSRTTEADLALLHDTLDLLRRSEAASAA